LIDGLPIPIGSHSTYIGYFVKNGFIGLLFVFIYWVDLFKQILSNYIKSKQRLSHSFIVIMFVSISLLFEDIDAFELNAYLFGILLGLCNNHRRNINLGV
jgi:O-antigen ligase